MLIVAWPALAQGGGISITPAPGSLGQHTVRSGETIYCIARAYGVHPRAIAEANGLSLLAVLSPGAALNIPAVQWSPVPPGPVCAAQFVSPFPGLPTPIPTRAVPSSPTSTAVTNAVLGEHVVQRRETLYCIGRAYGVWPTAIAQANRLVSPYFLSPGQTLKIPAVRWNKIPSGPVCAAQFQSPFVPVAAIVTPAIPAGGGAAPPGATGRGPVPTKTPIPTRVVPTKTGTP